MSAARRVLLRRGAAAVLTVCLHAARAGAQPVPLPDAPTSPALLPRYDWNLAAAHLASADARFDWDTRWVGTLDAAQYPGGRITLRADYQAILGHEVRAFDPYQSNYVLEASGSRFVRGTEIAGVFSHVSRHLADRANRQAVAENSLGVRVLRQVPWRRWTVDARADLRHTTERAFLDYTWLAGADARAHRVVRPRLQAYGHVATEAAFVAQTVAGRGTQFGGRLETGLRLDGVRGAVEGFAGVQRMIDADPVARGGRSWAYLGFRLLGR